LSGLKPDVCGLPQGSFLIIPLLGSTGKVRAIVNYEELS